VIVLDGFRTVFLGGALGWLLVELAKFGLAAYQGTIQGRYKTLPFWIGAVALIFVSGVVAVLNGVENVPLVKAVQYGINAPAIVSGLATAQKARKIASSMGISPRAGSTRESQSMPPSWLGRLFLTQSW
jgi:hypothetical protein